METAKRSGDENDKIRWKKKERHVTTHSNHRKSHKMSVQFNCRCQTVTIPSQFGCGEANGKNDESFRAACDAVLRVDSCFVFVRLEKLGRNKKKTRYVRRTGGGETRERWRFLRFLLLSIKAAQDVDAPRSRTWTQPRVGRK